MSAAGFQAIEAEAPAPSATQIHNRACNLRIEGCR